MAMQLLPAPELQFCDANGLPYAGGTVTTYIPGTDTLSNTWQDEAGTVLNTNPIVLDAAGRAIIWGSGDYRIVLRDVNGILIYDQVASTGPGETDLTALEAELQNEINRAEAAESLLTTNLNAEIARAEAAEGTLTTNLANEVARAEAEEANLQSQISALGSGGILPAGYSIRFGQVTSDGGGNFSGTFSPPFPSSCDSLVVTAQDISWWANTTSVSAGGFSGMTSSPLASGNWRAGPVPVDYIAIGH